MKNVRNLKIETKWRTVTSAPKILLTGQWLAQAGFQPGDQVEIAISAGCLTLRPVPAG